MYQKQNSWFGTVTIRGVNGYSYLAVAPDSKKSQREWGSHETFCGVC